MLSYFSDLLDARTKLEAWRRDYNEHRPHSSIGKLTPIEFANSVRTTAGSNNAFSKPVQLLGRGQDEACGVVNCLRKWINSTSRCRAP
jgi:hypothetical protein